MRSRPLASDQNFSSQLSVHLHPLRKLATARTLGPEKLRGKSAPAPAGLNSPDGGDALETRANMPVGQQGEKQWLWGGGERRRDRVGYVLVSH